ncbi:hypothetical protein [Paraconexibacter algicola]|uniref:hypothetical protein n=1 Tax=Paraconexibacter algicola TaxID=2133960 RepID=UPI00130483DA|nr:hypothetical protein [Paraconexibacter algicola]
MKTHHVLICALLLVTGAILVSTGAGTLAFLPLLLCMAMMGGMMWLMMRPSERDRDDR